MNDAEYSVRKEIIATCLAMEKKGINQGTSGNVSVRWDDGLLVTPSGLSYDMMAPEEIIYVESNGTPHGPHSPSSEWRFHLDIMLARSDIQAIVHAHPTYCTAHAILGRGIPAVHYMIAAAGGPSIRCAPYATFGTEELSRGAVEALEGRLACLLANHGLIACGPSLRKALWLANEVEVLAKQYYLSLQLGEPIVLSDEEMTTVIQKFKTGYGPKGKV
jgi:L-fuculose-phosphate aldolase